MKKYIIVYEDEKMKNENESTYEYFEDCTKTFDTLEEVLEEINKFENYFWRDEKELYKTIATAYSVEVDENNNFISDFEEIIAK